MYATWAETLRSRRPSNCSTDPGTANVVRRERTLGDVVVVVRVKGDG
jgi:hypothetical protein